jgi:hypothetical protein
MRFVDDEEFVGPLEEIVRLTRHRVFHDLDQIFGVNRLGCLRTEQNRASPPLVVRRDRKCVEARLASLSLRPDVAQLAHRMPRTIAWATTRGHAYRFDPTTRRVPVSSACAIPSSV